MRRRNVLIGMAAACLAVAGMAATKSASANDHPLTVAPAIYSPNDSDEDGVQTVEGGVQTELVGWRRGWGGYGWRGGYWGGYRGYGWGGYRGYGWGGYYRPYYGYRPFYGPRFYRPYYGGFGYGYPGYNYGYAYPYGGYGVGVGVW
jgi:hypothetical protein